MMKTRRLRYFLCFPAASMYAFACACIVSWLTACACVSAFNESRMKAMRVMKTRHRRSVIVLSWDAYVCVCVCLRCVLVNGMCICPHTKRRKSVAVLFWRVCMFCVLVNVHVCPHSINQG